MPLISVAEFDVSDARPILEKAFHAHAAASRAATDEIDGGARSNQ
jgi:hypothetical protein